MLLWCIFILSSNLCTPPVITPPCLPCDPCRKRSPQHSRWSWSARSAGSPSCEPPRPPASRTWASRRAAPSQWRTPPARPAGSARWRWPPGTWRSGSACRRWAPHLRWAWWGWSRGEPPTGRTSSRPRWGTGPDWPASRPCCWLCSRSGRWSRSDRHGSPAGCGRPEPACIRGTGWRCWRTWPGWRWGAIWSAAGWISGDSSPRWFSQSYRPGSPRIWTETSWTPAPPSVEKEGPALSRRAWGRVFYQVRGSAWKTPRSPPAMSSWEPLYPDARFPNTSTRSPPWRAGSSRERFLCSAACRWWGTVFWCRKRLRRETRLAWPQPCGPIWLWPPHRGCWTCCLTVSGPCWRC